MDFPSADSLLPFSKPEASGVGAVHNRSQAHEVTLKLAQKPPHSGGSAVVVTTAMVDQAEVTRRVLHGLKQWQSDWARTSTWVSRMRWRLWSYVSQAKKVQRWFRKWLWCRNSKFQQVHDYWVTNEVAHLKNMRLKFYKDSRNRQAGDEVRTFTKLHSTDQEKFEAITSLYWERRAVYRIKVHSWFVAFKSVHEGIKTTQQQLLGSAAGNLSARKLHAKLQCLQSEMRSVLAARPTFEFSTEALTMEDLMGTLCAANSQPVSRNSLTTISSEASDQTDDPASLSLLDAAPLLPLSPSLKPAQPPADGLSELMLLTSRIASPRTEGGGNTYEVDSDDSSFWAGQNRYEVLDNDKNGGKASPVSPQSPALDLSLIIPEEAKGDGFTSVVLNTSLGATPNQFPILKSPKTVSHPNTAREAIYQQITSPKTPKSVRFSQVNSFPPVGPSTSSDFPEDTSLNFPTSRSLPLPITDSKAFPSSSHTQETLLLSPKSPLDRKPADLTLDATPESARKSNRIRLTPLASTVKKIRQLPVAASGSISTTSDASPLSPTLTTFCAKPTSARKMDGPTTTPMVGQTTTPLPTTTPRTDPVSPTTTTTPKPSSTKARPSIVDRFERLRLLSATSPPPSVSSPTSPPPALASPPKSPPQPISLSPQSTTALAAAALRPMRCRRAVTGDIH